MSSANIFSFGGAKALQAQRAAKRDETRLITLCRWIDQDGLEACLAEILDDGQRMACLERMLPHLSFTPIAETLERAYERQLERLRHVPMPCDVCTLGAGGLEIRHPYGGAHPPTAALEQLGRTHGDVPYVVLLPPGSHEHLSGEGESNSDPTCAGPTAVEGRFTDVEGQVDGSMDFESCGLAECDVDHPCQTCRVLWGEDAPDPSDPCDDCENDGLREDDPDHLAGDRDDDLSD